MGMTGQQNIPRKKKIFYNISIQALKFFLHRTKQATWKQSGKGKGKGKGEGKGGGKERKRTKREGKGKKEEKEKGKKGRKGDWLKNVYPLFNRTELDCFGNLNLRPLNHL